MNPKKEIKDMSSSVRARLLQSARKRNEDFNLIMTRYGIERLLYRLSQSAYAERFVLKGAMLFSLWTDLSHRSTKDVDLLSFGSPQLERLRFVFQEICKVNVDDDGLIFDQEKVVAQRLKAGQEYEGVRLVIPGLLGSAKLRIQVDIGFGDAVTPKPQSVVLPTLLDHPEPTLLAYPQQTVIAEKLCAAVVLGMNNTRMKDFFDLVFLSEQFSHYGQSCIDAVRATFERRRIQIPTEIPIAFSSSFAEEKDHQWKAFLRKSSLPERRSLPDVIDHLKSFFDTTFGSICIESSSVGYDLES